MQTLSTEINDLQRKIEFLSSGVSDYINKPVLDKELLARLRNVVYMRHLFDQVDHNVPKCVGWRCVIS